MVETSAATFVNDWMTAERSSERSARIDDQVVVLTTQSRNHRRLSAIAGRLRCVLECPIARVSKIRGVRRSA
ncbi:hypothetical protein ACTMU2_04115 [Cupriavidus basilensis]